MNRIRKTGALTAALATLGALGSGTAAAQWTMESQPYTHPNAKPVLELPSMDGSGWLTLHGNQAMDQVSYATSGATLDPMFPIQARYEFLSHSPRKEDARLGGFQLMDASVSNTGIHRDSFGCAMQGDYLSVGFQWLGDFGSDCNGSSPRRNNFVLLRGAGNQLLDERPSPVRLACSNYTRTPGDRVPEWECHSRDEAIAKGFVHRVEAVLQPKVSGPGFLFDLSLDGHHLHAGRDIDIAAPDRLRFGLFASVDHSGGVQDVRNVQVTQDAVLTSEVDNRCLDVQTGAAARPIVVRACSGAITQTFRRAGTQLKVGKLCVEASGPATNAALVAAPCNGSARQSWVLDTQQRLRVESRPLCVTVAAGKTQTRLQSCNDTKEQRFLPISA